MVIRAKEARLRQYFFYMRNVRYIAKLVFRRRIKIKSGGGKQAKKGRKTERCRLQVATVFCFKRLRCFGYFFYLLSPLGRVDFTSKASKRRERSCSSRTLRASNIVYVNNLYRLDFHFIPSSHSPHGACPFCRFATFSPFHRENLPQRGRQDNV